MTEKPRQRLDKWLWCARVVKSRTLAAGLIAAGHVRLNRVKVIKPAHDVGPGDVLTVVLNARVRVLHVDACAVRRGPASAARLLYSEPSMSVADDTIPQKEDATGDGTC